MQVFKEIGKVVDANAIRDPDTVVIEVHHALITPFAVINLVIKAVSFALFAVDLFHFFIKDGSRCHILYSFWPWSDDTRISSHALHMEIL